ncbi:MAG: SDR family oxidoreductase [Cyanobacteria bacterium]|nr:SDR family oxidoreductase [Cyanobacteriota bacterium]
MKGLLNKIALVTGATGLIGSAITYRLCSEGTTVIVASRKIEKARNLIESYPQSVQNKMIPLEINLSNETSITEAFNWLISQNIIPNILVCNASLRDGIATSFNEISHQSFTSMFEVDVAGHFILARYMISNTSEQKSASIVMLSSVYASAGVDFSIYPEKMSPTPVQYATVKAGILGLTKYLAGLWGAKNVRVNAVMSGGIRSTERQENNFVNNYSNKTMLGRMAIPEEIANTVVFLASDESSYITGECIAVDGGFLAW